MTTNHVQEKYTDTKLSDLLFAVAFLTIYTICSNVSHSLDLIDIDTEQQQMGTLTLAPQSVISNHANKILSISASSNSP